MRARKPMKVIPLDDQFFARTVQYWVLGYGPPMQVGRVVREPIPKDLLGLRSVSTAFRRFAARSRAERSA